ncbi:hypothetical protein GCK32_002524 [Trichostrongylus colubriformis]|uniref:Uncharacterized protein n=1 Tax=Trichostrongylus colubriformis TaxID=6319 RepID=A0AAN8FKL4_TRICO
MRTLSVIVILFVVCVLIVEPGKLPLRFKRQYYGSSGMGGMSGMGGGSQYGQMGSGGSQYGQMGGSQMGGGSPMGGMGGWGR